MSGAIYDEIRKLPVSRQRKYQLRNKAEGLCQGCAAPSGGRSRCAYCRYQDCQRQIKRRNQKIMLAAARPIPYSGGR